MYDYSAACSPDVVSWPLGLGSSVSFVLNKTCQKLDWVELEFNFHFKGLCECVWPGNPFRLYSCHALIVGMGSGSTTCRTRIKQASGMILTFDLTSSCCWSLTMDVGGKCNTGVEEGQNLKGTSDLNTQRSCNWRIFFVWKITLDNWQSPSKPLQEEAGNGKGPALPRATEQNW